MFYDRSRNGAKRQPARGSPRAPTRALTYGEARQANLEAETRVRHAEAQALEDEHALFAQEARARQLANERREIANGLLLIGLVGILSLIVAEVTLALAAPGISHPGESLQGLARVLLPRG